MSKLRIGVIVYQESKPTEGGGHSYYENLLNGINNFDFHTDIEIVNIVFYDKEKPTTDSKKESIFIRGKQLHKKEIKHQIKRIARFVNLGIYFSKLNPFINFLVNARQEVANRRIEEVLQKNKIDLIYYLKPEFAVLNYPFITTHWDVAHKSMPAFPETALDSNYRIREDYYLYTLNKAFLIFCESESGAAELKKFYSLYEPKVKVVPMFASSIINVQLTEEKQIGLLEKFGLKKDQFFLYPAQFWSCKNHYHLVLAFKKLIDQRNDQSLKLILAGSDNGNMTYIKQVIKDLSITDRVIIPGFVSTDELNAMYRNALALVMPTFLGPTNIPLIEAAHLKCPVLCSDFEGHREIMGDTALYFDPANINSITDRLIEVLEHQKRTNMTTAAFTHINNSPFRIQNSLLQINKILQETRTIRKTWGIEYSV